MRTAILTATVLVLGLGACFEVLGQTDHFVSITVTNDKIDAPSPDPVRIAGRGHVIHWEIKTPGYSFASNGIVIHGDDAGEFDGGHSAEQGKKFQVNDKNSFQKTYKYTVNVMKGATPLAPLDPSIVND